MTLTPESGNPRDKAPPPVEHEVWCADECGKVPFLEVVENKVEHQERIGYLQLFSGYFCQLGLSDAEHGSLGGLSPAARSAVLRGAVERAGWEVKGGTAEDAAALIRRELETYRPIIRAANIALY